MLKIQYIQMKMSNKNLNVSSETHLVLCMQLEHNQHLLIHANVVHKKIQFPDLDSLPWSYTVPKGI